MDTQFLTYIFVGLSFALYIGIAVWSRASSTNEFYIAAGLVGLVMGGIQALSRSTFSKFLPETDNTTSFFSFYDVAQKVSIVLGMILFGTIDQITGSMRNAILFFTIFFAVGAFLLIRLDKKMKS